MLRSAIFSEFGEKVLRGRATAFVDGGPPPDFNLGSYLARYADVRAWAGPQAEKGLRHFMRHGAQEQRSGAPDAVDPAFIEGLYGVTAPAGLTPEEAPAFLRAALGVDQKALLFCAETEFLSYHGITPPAFSAAFDHDYYALRAFPDSTAVLSRAVCLQHFCETGRHEGADISDDWRFDEEFYHLEYVVAGKTSATPAPRARLFRQWIEEGWPADAWPNLRMLARGAFGLDLPAALQAQFRALGRVAPGVDCPKPSAILQRVIDDPLSVIPHIDSRDEGVARFLCAIGDRFSVRGDERTADFLYAHVLRARPDCGPALRHRADQIHRAGLFGLDAALRAEIVAKGVADKWTFLNFARSLTETGDLIGAADILAEGVKAHPEDWRLRQKAQAGANAALDQAIAEAPTLALLKDYQTARDAVRRALVRATPAFGGGVYGRPIRRIAICAFHALPQCRFYRVELKQEQLAALGVDVEVFDLERDAQACLARLMTLDLIIFHRTPAVPVVIDLIRKAVDLGVATAYDIDDLIFDEDHFPPPLASYAGQIDAKTHAELAANAPLYAHAMSMCDYGLTSTQALAAHMKARVRSGEVFVLPNALTRRHMVFAETPAPTSDEVVIFYGSGTRAHKQDFRDLIEPALARAFETHGRKLRALIFGYIEMSPTLAPYRDRIHVVAPLSNVEDYWSALQQANINVSVLQRSDFTDCKSEIKWLEAAMMGIPSVLSRTRTHEEIVEDGVTGLLCDTAEDFAEAIDRLVRNADLRKRIGAAAREKALRDYGLASQCETFRSVLQRIEDARPIAKNRLLIVNVFYPPQAIGGATRVVYDNVTDLRRILGDDWSIDVICALEGGETPYEINCHMEDGVRVFAITAPARPDIDAVAEDPAMGAAVDKCLEIIKPTVAHFHCIQRLTVSAVDAVRLRRIPYLVTMHDGWWISPNHFILGPGDREEYYSFSQRFGDQAVGAPPARLAPLRRALRSAKTITTVSRPFAKVIERAGLANICVIENGVSNDMTIAARAPNETGRVRLAHLGGTQRHKGLQLIRNILLTRSFKNLSLLVIDHAYEPRSVTTEVWGDTPVEIRGKIQQARVAELYATIDVLLAPSIWPESYGLVTREALAAGCWVVASDRGAIGDCVSPGENGFIVDVASPRALLAVLEKIDADPQTYMRAPEHRPPLRMAREQAGELARLYREVCVT